MTDPADRFLEERLHALARGAPVPVVPSEHDVRRGRRRLLRVRLAMATGTTATLAAVLGVTSLTAGAPKATDIAPASHVPSALPATPSSTPSAEGEETRNPGGQRVDGDGAPVDGSTGGAGPDAAGVPVPPGSQVKHAQTQAAATAGVPGHHLTWPATDPSDLPTSTPAELPSDDPTGSPTGMPTDLPTPTDPTTDPTPPDPTPTGDTKVRLARVLAAFNAVLAEHLDPDRNHLQPYDRRVDPRVTRKADGLLFSLGSTYRWEDGGSRSALKATVASGWDQVDWDCGASYADWTCHPADSSVGRAEVATHDGVRQVAVEHDSGQVVVLTADPSADIAETALVAAASDDRLVLPGAAPQAPPTIDSAAFASAGEAALLTEGQSFDHTVLDRSPLVRGTWSADGGQGGTLAWSARPIYSGGTFTCLATYLRCFSVAVDDAGTTVHVALLRNQAGWLVRYDGPSYAVRVWSSDRTFPRKRAVAFVTDGAWQPTR
jgi:hypothetical protein